MRPFRTLCIAFALSIPATRLSAQCNSWSQNFQSATFVRDVSAMTLFQGAVHVFAHDPQNQPLFARMDGAAWKTIAPAPNFAVHDATSYDLGGGARLYAVGEFSTPFLRVASFDGTAWVPLGSGLPLAGAYADEVVGYDDGSGPAVYVGGGFTNPALNIARWNGTAWSPVGTGLNGTVTSLAVFDEGSGPRLFAGGAFTIPPGNVARWDGASWTPVGSGTSGTVLALTVGEDGGGPALFASVSGPDRVQRWNGASWTAIGAPLGSAPIALATFDDGSGPALYAVHLFGAVSRWNGTSWSPLQSSTIFGARRLLSTPSALYIAGNITTGGTVADGTVGLMAWNGGLVHQPAGGDGIRGFALALRVHDDGSGPALYTAGRFSQAGNVPAGAVARFDGERWSAVGAGLSQSAGATVFALAEYDDGSGGGPELYAGGDLSIAPAGNVGVAKWDGVQWIPIPGAPCCANTVQSLIAWDDGSGPALFVGGDFSFPGQNIVKWNGSTWSTVGTSGVGATILASFVAALAVFDNGSGEQLYAAGYFFDADGQSVMNVARWNGTTWSPVGNGLGGGNPQFVYSLAVHDEGAGPALYAAGGFTLGGSAGAARWNGSTWLPLANGPGQDARALISFDDGTGPALYAAQTGVRRWRNGAWTTIGNFAGGNAFNSGSAVYDAGHGPELYFAGGFHRLDATTSVGIARWSPDVRGSAYCFGDGSATACPCGNASAPADRAGCLNSFGTGGALRATGCAHVTSDDVVLHGTGMTNGSVLYFQGTATIAIGNGAVFGDGLRCVGGTVIRLATVANASGASQYPDATHPTPISIRGMIAPTGGTRAYQAWYRALTPFCGAGNWNLTNAVSLEWAP